MGSSRLPLSVTQVVNLQAGLGRTRWGPGFSVSVYRTRHEVLNPNNSVFTPGWPRDREHHFSASIIICISVACAGDFLRACTQNTQRIVSLRSLLVVNYYYYLKHQHASSERQNEATRGFLVFLPQNPALPPVDLSTSTISAQPLPFLLAREF